MTALEHAGAAALAVCALLAASAVATAAAQEPSLRIVVLEGEDSINIIDRGTAVQTLVEVRDRNGLPVPGATVLLLLVEGGTATLNARLQQVALTTNAAGRAAVAVNPTASGAVELSVSAAFGGETATLTVVQSNYATVAEAVAAGVSAPAAPAAGTATPKGGRTPAGAGMGRGAMVGIAAAAGAAVGVAVAVAGGEDPAPPPPPPSPPPTTASPDRAVLMELYNATDGPSWVDNTNWGGDAPLDEWFGVSTDEDGRVTALDLPGNRLTGTVPSSLGGLTRLRRLVLAVNQLAGEIPSSLDGLASLVILHLTENRLTGAIPPSLGRLANPSATSGV